MKTLPVQITPPGSESQASSREIAVVRSIISPDWLKEQIARTYSIDVPISCELVQSGSNDRYLLKTPREQLLVRVCQAGWRSVPEVCYELKLVSLLASRGLAVPIPVPGRDGQLACALTAPEGVRTLAVFTCPHGQWFAWDTEENSRVAGRALASIHKTLDDFTCDYPRPNLDLEHLLQEPMAALEPFLAHRPEHWHRLQSFARRILQEAHAVMEEDLDWGPCHGNFCQQTILLTSDHELAIVDFDDCGPGYRLFDLVAVQRSWLYQFQRPLWEAFRMGYEEIRPLAERDLKAVPLFHAVSHLWRLGNHTSTASRAGSVYPSDRKIERIIEYSRNWEEQYPTMLTSNSNSYAVPPLVAHTQRCGGDQETSLGSAAVSRCILSSAMLQAEISARYDIEPLRCQLIRRASNDTYVLTAGLNRYIARLYRTTGPALTTISYELDFLKHLAGKGLPVSAPISNCDGGLTTEISAPEGSRYLVLFDYCDGSPLSWFDEEGLRLAGRLAAMIHSASADFVPVHSRHSWDLAMVAEQPLRAVAPFFCERRDDLAFLLDTANQLTSRIQALLEEGLSSGVCHGDFHVKNIHLHDCAVKIFDFDHCGPGWLAFDCTWVFHASHYLKQPGIWAAFLRGYREVGFLSEGDLRLIPLLVGLMHILVLDHDARRVKADGLHLMATDRLDRKVSVARTWCAEYLEVGEPLRKL